jgi:hypothetical protein
MDYDEHATQGKKRSADDVYEDGDSVMETGNDQNQNYVDVVSAPRVISRQYHRLTHVVAEGSATPAIADSNAPTKVKKQPFNVFKAIVRHPNLFFQFTIRLPVDTLVDLYAIDKEFHWRFNKYCTSIIHDWVKIHARDAGEICSWAMYARHCISDPELKPMDGKPHLARDAPSLRWVQMVVYRDKTVRRILTYMALDGHWMLIELKHHQAREKFVTNRDYWSDTDILLFSLFLTKLDMHFSDPIHGQGLCCLSELMLTQPSLTYLSDLVSGKAKVGYDELADMVTWTYPNEDLDIEQHPWLDEDANPVQPHQWGILTNEGWLEDGEPMPTPMDLVILEGVRRKLPIQKHSLDFVLYGYTDPKTGKNLPFPRLQVVNGKKVIREMEYDPAKKASLSKWTDTADDDRKRALLKEHIRQHGRWDLGAEAARLMGVPFHG